MPRTIQNNALADLLKDAGALFFADNRPAPNAHKNGPVYDCFRKHLPEMLTNKLGLPDSVYLIKGSAGDREVYAQIPWVAIYNKGITKSALRGIYIVFLYSADSKRVYLSLNQGFTYFQETYPGRNNAIQKSHQIARILRYRFGKPNYLDEIKLNATTALAKGYEAGHIIGFEYDLSNMPSDATIVSNIRDLVDILGSIKADFGQRDFRQYYDYLLAEDDGELMENSSSPRHRRVTTRTVAVVVDDRPEPRRDPVFDSQKKAKYKRSDSVRQSALDQAEHKCVFDEDHFTFLSSDGENMYVEAHHLIPMEYQEQFENSIDIPANVVSLCSVCHDKIHHGTAEAKEEVINNLFEKRKDRLAKAGISITISKLLQMYQGDIE